MRHRICRSAGIRATLCWAALLVPLAVAQGQGVSRDRVMAALPQLAAMTRAQIASGGVPGLAIAVVHDDDVVYLEGFGRREMGRSETVDPDTVFQLASMSKPISATVVATLVSAGLIEWGTRVAELAPEFQLHASYPTAEVTVRDFFNHRSGLPGTSGDDLEEIGYGRDHVLHQLRYVPPSSSFRNGYAYSNAGITMGAIAAVKPTGKTWETVAEERLFGPLGMTATSYRHDAFLERNNAAAQARFAHAPVPPTPALPDAAYLGDYANAYVGLAQVALRDGVLTLVVGPRGARSYPLRPFDRDLFLYVADPEMPDKPSALRFAIGPDGRAAAMKIESLDSNGLGTLRRNGT